MSAPVLRFAPSPNGHLHLGHAYSALLNQHIARELGGRFLVRIEDIDTVRCTDKLCADALEDLEWLGLEWDGPVRRQSEHLSAYTAALNELEQKGLLYRGYLTRSEIKQAIADKELATGTPWPRDPDGAPLYPGGSQEPAVTGRPFALRLNMQKALAQLADLVFWPETGVGPQGETGDVPAVPSEWGDVILARKDTPTSYHLSVVVDDALQGITHVVRGQDLFYATAVHRVLQQLLGLPCPTYQHHGLILDDDGRKLSKSARDTSLRELRADGVTARQIRTRLGFG
ncbi:tRNA glutamyl-Q(34) synthetase GluQRS [Pseudovibrio sp. SPO723]|uniref:tRNA glutamyl-Q(34) synthetase GluQRS n=1 Tax=Nesiotobacter zosterae TaxID=392721 RepID=UPI0029C49FFF|nr:tRNA glutamyl-Q(34) synthetase GluQRS [Pseudovibrio sp. SPO723]MDX5594993.1 tRNA glutamyl-Q(34) synthetase GluQRS [Pseudovibrio sp. SPO723]